MKSSIHKSYVRQKIPESYIQIFPYVMQHILFLIFSLLFLSFLLLFLIIIYVYFYYY